MTDSTIYLVDKERLDTLKGRIKSDKKYSSNVDNDKLLNKVVHGYLYLVSAFESYKIYCQSIHRFKKSYMNNYEMQSLLILMISVIKY